MPAVTVISPVHNAADFLDETIESVLQQSLTDWAYILVDDGSTDRSAAIIEQYAALDRRITLLQQHQQGACSARNRGAGCSDPSSRYLVFLDADDKLEAQALAVMSSYLDEHPEVGLLGCQWTLIDEVGAPLARQRPRTRRVPGFILPRQLKPHEKETPFVTFYCGSGQGPCAMYRRDVFLRTAGWDENLAAHQDSDMFIQMSLLAEVHYLPDQLYQYRRHGQNMTNDRRRMYEAQAVLREKWDHYVPKTPKEQRKLAHARRYYYSTYHPVRSFYRGVRSLVNFARRPRRSELSWAWHHFGEGVSSLYTFLRHERSSVMAQRSFHSTQ